MIHSKGGAIRFENSNFKRIWVYLSSVMERKKLLNPVMIRDRMLVININSQAL